MGAAVESRFANLNLAAITPTATVLKKEREPHPRAFAGVVACRCSIRSHI
jgi:hypothetical protein